MIEIRYLQAESGANKFGTCNCCGKSSGDDPLMISIKFRYYGHGTIICLCDDCKKKLIEALPPANNSEIPNSSDTISRAKAIETLMDAMNDVGVLDAEDINTVFQMLPPSQLGTNLAEVGMDCISRQAAIKALDKRFDSIPMEQTTEILLLRRDLRELPPTQPERIKGHWVNGRCDKCNEHAPFWCMASTYHESNFCPNCGADMREVTE